MKSRLMTQEAQDVLSCSNIPPLFAVLLRQKSLSLESAFALRADAPFQRYLLPAAPKPLSISAKTGNWGLSKGVIAVDPSLAKTEIKEGKRVLMARLPEDIPFTLTILRRMIHYVSLQEVVMGLYSQEYELVGTEEDILVSNRIVIRAMNKNPEDNDIIFSINLNETHARVFQQPQLDFEKIVVGKMLEHIPAPRWWRRKWGDFPTCQTQYYPAQYKHQQESSFKDILIYGITDNRGSILPITGDQDLLWVSVPVKKHAQLKEYQTVIDSRAEGGVEKIYAARVALHLALGGKPEDLREQISNDSIAGLGCVTVFESYVIDEINRAFMQSGIRHVRNLIQHACENHNPRQLSSLNVPIVHIWKGKMAMTYSERELVHFVVTPQYPNENIVDVHPKWDMRLWAQYVAKQIALKQPVVAETLKVYNEYCIESQMEGDSEHGTT